VCEGDSAGAAGAGAVAAGGWYAGAVAVGRRAVYGGRVMATGLQHRGHGAEHSHILTSRQVTYVG